MSSNVGTASVQVFAPRAKVAKSLRFMETRG